MKHNELKKFDIVLFKRPDYDSEKEYYHDGNVIYVDENRKKVCICYLEGYKSRSDEFPYDKVIAKYDPKGEFMKFDNYSGNSILLEM